MQLSKKRSQTTIKDYRQLLRSAKVVLGFGKPKAGPTIIEAIHLRSVLMVPSQQMCPKITPHPLVVLTDELTREQIVEQFVSIFLGPAIDYIPVPGFTPIEYVQRVKRLIPPKLAEQ
eukprot:TRINITY_DN9307_c0_g1_i1.p2 TRINITY_DN9307_c0_g1~~TRINITY_DN9307_c0_g1_i1.p2  ORF type:complete len:117 (+),score=15.03 TRINITY_DN9307_c0_g1_i1:329-679(+)